MSNPYDPNQPFQPQQWPNPHQPTGHYPPPQQQSWGPPPQGQPWNQQPQFAPPAYYPPPRPPKSNTTRNVLLAVAGVFVLLIVLVVAFAPSKSNESVANAGSSEVLNGSQAIGSAKIGDSIEVTTDDGTAIVTISDLTTAEPSDFTTPKGTIMQITVVIEVKSGEWPVNPLYFEARTDKGNVIDPELFSSADDDLGATHSQAGEKVRGTIQFDVPNGESINLFILNGVLFDRLADWTA